MTLEVLTTNILYDVAENVKEGKKGAKAQLIDELANHIVEHYHIVTPPQWMLYCYQDGIYKECENEVKALIESYGRTLDISSYINKNVVNEIIEKVKRLTFLSDDVISRSRWWLALKNGLLNIKTWVNKGEIEFKDFEPGIFKTARLNAEFKLGKIIATDDWFNLGKELCPNIHQAFIQWVGEQNARVLYEIIAYTLLPDYPIQVAFMLVGEGANGKSTYLNLLKRFLGKGNYSSIALQDLTTNRFMLAELYGKLANIFPDLPKTPLRNSGIFKALTGEDELHADIKHRRGFSFMNYAKLIFSANELPQVTDMTHAFWRRWVLVEFPNRIENPDPHYIDKLTTQEELNGLLIVSLFALRDLLRRRKFSVSGNFKEFWLRRSNTVYAFIKDKVEVCDDPRTCYVEKEELYNEYVAYCEDNDLNAVSTTKFTQELKRMLSKARLGKIRKDGRLVRVWYGIRLKDYYEEEGEEQLTLTTFLGEAKKTEEETPSETINPSPEDLTPTEPETPNVIMETSSETKMAEAKDVIREVAKIIMNGCRKEDDIIEAIGNKEEVIKALAKLEELGVVVVREERGLRWYCP